MRRATRRIRTPFLALLLVIAAGGCRGGDAPKTIEFVDAGSGQFGWEPRESGYGPQALLLRSRAAWAAMKDSFTLDPATSPADAEARLGGVDFQRQSLLVVTLGQQNTTGHAIRLERIETGPPVKLVMRGTHPASDAIVGEALTHPFHLVVVNATVLPIDAIYELDAGVTKFQRTVKE